MKKDISTRQDVELLVNAFYEKVKKDHVIGVFFTEVVKVNWEKHLPVMYDFFENMLFFTGKYSGNPMELHKHLSRRMPITKAHFNQWELLFYTTVDEYFQGPTADLVKQKARSIASIMQLKIKEGNAANDNIY